ncbi:MAG: hypothetical protein AB7G25_09290 [Sphingomonadaceae bacterium]
MSDSINPRIGEEGQSPLLVIAEDSSEAAPAMIVVEPSAPELPAPAVEAIQTAKPPKAEAKTPGLAAKPTITAEPAAPAEPVKDIAAAEPAPTAASPEQPAASAPLPQPQQESAASDAPVEAHKPLLDLRRYIPLAAVSMAVFASGLSVIGLLVASRTVAETKLVLEQVQANQHRMQSLDTLIKRVEELRRREQIALARVERINSGKPVTATELRSAMTGLQLAMTRYQLGSGNGTLSAIRDGQYELAERISTIYRRVEKIDSQVAKMAVSSSPKGKRAGDREPTS